MDVLHQCHWRFHCLLAYSNTLLFFVTLFRCGESLEINKVLISEEQLEYQREMERKYQDFQQLLAPLIGTGKKAHPRLTK